MADSCIVVAQHTARNRNVAPKRGIVELCLLSVFVIAAKRPRIVAITSMRYVPSEAVVTLAYLVALLVQEVLAAIDADESFSGLKQALCLLSLSEFFKSFHGYLPSAQQQHARPALWTRKEAHHN